MNEEFNGFQIRKFGFIRYSVPFVKNTVNNCISNEPIVAKSLLKLELRKIPFMKNRPVYIFLALFAISCSSGDEAKQDTRTVFKYNEMGAVTSLDPAKASSFENIWVVNQLFNGLVEMNDSLSIQPSIARSWTISTDGLTYTFNLRDNVFFHDNDFFPQGKGRKVTAADFVYTFNRLLDAKVSNATTLLTNVDNKNGNAFEAISDSVFVIHMEKAFTPFLGILTMKYFSVVPKEVIEGAGEEFRRKPCGTGPFKFKMWEEGSKLVFVKNLNYFEYAGNERLPYLDAVSISFIRDRETSFLNFLKGDLDMVSGVDAINTDEVLTAEGKLKESYEPKFKMLTQPFLETNYLGFFIDEQQPIVKNSPLKIKAIRQAINYGFDRKKMVMYLRKNLGYPATAGFVPPGLPSFDASKVIGYDYNPDKVKELLFLAGYPDGKGLPDISLATTEQYLELAEYIQSQLSEFGIKMKIDVQKASVLFESIAHMKVNFFRKSWNADYPDAENFLSLFYSKNWSPKGFNYTHYQNPQFDILYEKSQSELNDSIRYDYYRQMDQLIIDNAPVVPLYYGQVVRLVQNNVEGLTSNSMNMLSLKRVKKAKD
jgi:oligopeptide transport system substrate-binding protein